ncbi:MAG: type II toxin-antitoxin system VapC family toxin [Zoogloeaceae bacterium]|nr:type II toxin-antitoxin system VapC family toxin [Zoogloeaceae bacterium]MCK6383986.1 type II toxin-antitoxin system VapC family toxin [Rhodocyclaceae bacterium]
MIYLDTSAAVPLFVREPASAAVDAWFEACADPLLSSDWIVTEFASALSLKERSGALSTKDARAVWRGFEAFCDSGLRLVAVSRQAFKEGARLARQQAHGLRAGDALHLAVALETGAKTVATLDTAFAANARRLKFRTVRFVA